MTRDEGIGRLLSGRFPSTGSQLVNSPADLETRLREWVYLEPRGSPLVKPVVLQRPIAEAPLKQSLCRPGDRPAKGYCRYLKIVPGGRGGGCGTRFSRTGRRLFEVAINVVSRIHKEFNAEVPLELF